VVRAAAKAPTAVAARAVGVAVAVAVAADSPRRVERWRTRCGGRG
jgi:hypothetical protein